MNKIRHIIKLGWAYRFTRSTFLSYPPFQYTIEPTNVCNLSCSFCPQSDPGHHKLRSHGKLTVDHFQLFLDRVKEAAPGNDKINLTLDGEPFLNRDMITFIEMISKAGYVAVFASNGTLLDRSTIDRLSQSGVFHISIDFAADEQTFETIRGQKGHYFVVLDNLRYLAEKAKTRPDIHLRINDIAPFAGSEPKASLSQLRALFDGDLRSHVRFTSRQFHNFCGHLPYEKDEEHYHLCPYPWTQLAVTYDGDCVACCRDTAARTILGNVFEKSIMEIWNGGPYRQLRHNLLERKPELNQACKNCDLPYSGGEKRWRIGYMLNSLLRR